jgi:hypothetical protein
LVAVSHQRTVVGLVRHAVIVVIFVASIARRIVIVVHLVGVDDSETVVGTVLDSIGILILLPVTWIPHPISIVVPLVGVPLIGAVVAGVSDVVSVVVPLRGVVNAGTVVEAVDNPVCVHVRVARVSVSVSVHVSLVRVGGVETAVTEVSNSVSVQISLANIADKRTVVILISDPIVVIVSITQVTDSIIVHVSLSAVGYLRTVIQGTGRVVAANGEKRVGNSVQIVVRRTLFPVAKHPDGALAVELPGSGVEAVFWSLAVVDPSRAGVREDTGERALLHVAL